MLVFILASTDIYNQRELNSIKMAVGLSIVVALVASIFSLLNSDSNRLEVTIFSSIDPNEFSSSLCFCCAYLLSIIFSTKKRLLTILGIACCFVLIFLTGSRGGILNICVIFFVWFLFYGGKYRFKILLVAFVFAVIIFSVLFRDLSSYMLNRFNIFASLSSDGGAGRFNIWMAALNKFNKSNLAYKFFGYGYGMFVPSVNYIAVGHTNAYMSHNMWIDCLITGGIIGVLLLFCAFLSVLYYAWKNKNCWGFLAVISFLVSGLSIDVQFYKTFSIILVIAFIFKNGEVKNEVKRNCTNIQCRAISKKLS
jgi:O-antigen ligase